MIENTQNPETFDIDEWLVDAALPEESVDVYKRPDVISETAGRKITMWDPVNGREQLVHYDSGWRDVSGLLTNGWTVGTDFRIRREGYTVKIRIHNLNGSAASTSAVWQLPSGFRPQGTTEVFLRSDEAGTVMKLMTIRWDGAIFFATGTVTTNNGATEITFSTTGNVPTTLPGTAISTIPYT